MVSDLFGKNSKIALIVASGRPRKYRSRGQCAIIDASDNPKRVFEMADFFQDPGHAMLH